MVLTAGSSAAASGPLSVPGCVGYFDLSDATTVFTDTGRTTPVASDGDLIAGVTDQSSSAAHLSGTTTMRPTWKANVFGSKSAALFDNVANELHATGAGLAQVVNGTDLPVSVVLAVKPNWTTANDTMVSWGRASNGNPFLFFDLTATSAVRFQHRDDAAASATDVGAASTLTNAAHVVTLLYTGTAATIRVDGTVISSPSQPVAVDVGTTTLDQFALGSLWRNAATGSDFWTGHIGAAAIYNSALSVPNAQLVERYLGTYFSITVA